MQYTVYRVRLGFSSEVVSGLLELTLPLHPLNSSLALCPPVMLPLRSWSDLVKANEWDSIVQSGLWAVSLLYCMSLYMSLKKSCLLFWLTRWRFFPCSDKT